MQEIQPRPYRILFLTAAIFNLLAGVGLLTYRAWFGWLGVLPNPDDSLFVVLFAALVLGFGYGYYLAADDFPVLRPFVRAAAFSKLAVFAIALAYFLNGHASWHLAAIASGDLVYAALFLWALQDYREKCAAT